MIFPKQLICSVIYRFLSSAIVNHDSRNAIQCINACYPDSYSTYLNGGSCCSICYEACSSMLTGAKNPRMRDKQSWRRHCWELCSRNFVDDMSLNWGDLRIDHNWPKVRDVVWLKVGTLMEVCIHWMPWREGGIGMRKERVSF